MTSNALFVSRYDHRVKLVQDIVKANTQLSDQKCRALAVRLVHALDTIPEKVR
jgi:hypothetical protein